MSDYKNRILNLLVDAQARGQHKNTVLNNILSLDEYIESGGELDDAYYFYLYNFINKKRSRKGPLNNYGPKFGHKEVIGIGYVDYMNSILKSSPRNKKNQVASVWIKIK